MQINVEYRNLTDFSGFFSKIKGKTVAVAFDVNTKPYALDFIERIKSNDCKVLNVEFGDEELIPSEDKCQYLQSLAKDAEYLLAVGSGTLNDMAKAVSTNLNIPCGVLATAASMDGYCSKGSALMRKGVKVTDTVHTPSDVLIDLEIVRKAPRLMTAAGFDDEAGSIGKRYRREDEIGTPFCITYDFDSETDNCVTLRDRDTKEQIRLPIDQVASYIQSKIEF